MKRPKKDNPRSDPYFCACRVCKASFYSKKRDGKFCGARCRKKAQRMRDAARAKQPGLFEK